MGCRCGHGRIWHEMLNFPRFNHWWKGGDLLRGKCDDCDCTMYESGPPNEVMEDL